MSNLQTFLNYAPANLIVPTILFVLLSPGFLLTTPPGPSGRRFMSGETSRSAVFTHALVFMVIYYLLRANFPQYY